MSFTIGNAKDDLSGILHGTTVNSITGIDRLLERAGRTVLSRIEPSESARRSELTVYDGVEEYDPPDDFKDRKVRDIAPQVNRSGSDNFRNVVGNDFERDNENNTFSVVEYDGSKVLKLKKRLTPAKKSFAHFTDDEGWAADGTGLTSLTLDRLIYAEGGTSLKFNKASAQTSGNIATSTISSVDLTDYQDIAAAFLRLWLPNAAAAAGLTSLNLRWGSSVSAYWANDATTPHNRSAFKAGWNLVRFDWPTSSTGTPDETAVDYARLALTTTSAAINAIRVDDLFFSIGKILDFEYFSSYAFRDSNGTWRESVENDETIINLGPTSYNIFLYEAAILCAQQVQGENSSNDITFFREMLHGNGKQAGLYAEYLEGNPNEAIQPRTRWY
jgi:hypothetical protein